MGKISPGQSITQTPYGLSRNICCICFVCPAVLDTLSSLCPIIEFKTLDLPTLG